MIKNLKKYLVNYYKILDWPMDSKPEEIKKKYIELAKRYHPDRDIKNKEKFIEIKNAYEQLKDSKNRNIINDNFNKNNKNDDFKDFKNQHSFYYQVHLLEYESRKYIFKF